MSASSPRRGSSETSGRRRNHGSSALRELIDRLELRERLRAIIDELDRLDADVDVPRTIAEGAIEELDQALATEAAA